jgi:hypothetical protein
MVNRPTYAEIKAEQNKRNNPESTDNNESFEFPDGILILMGVYWKDFKY